MYVVHIIVATFLHLFMCIDFSMECVHIAQKFLLQRLINFFSAHELKSRGKSRLIVLCYLIINAPFIKSIRLVKAQVIRQCSARDRVLYNSLVARTDELSINLFCQDH